MLAQGDDPMTQESIQDYVEPAVELAAQWQKRANQLLTPEEKSQQDQLRRLLDHPKDKIVLTKLFDQSFRSGNPARVADQIHYLLKTFGMPDFFSSTEKALAYLFQGVGRHLPSVSIPKMVEKMRENSRRLIIPGERGALYAHLEKRKGQGLQVNLNHLGEAVLGEQEAARRLEQYRADLEDPRIEYISVKLSTLYSQIQPLAFDHSVDVLDQRLSRLFQTALDNTFERADGTRAPKFVNLDMEAYSDLALTVAVFKKVLEKEAFKTLPAGIVLQAYLPDAYAIQQDLTQWALARVAEAGAPIKIRIVKGANMEMEKLEAVLNNWPLAPFDNKPDVDANYKRMLLYGLQPDHVHAVRLGIASHNLFELAFAHTVARARGVETFMIFEMLEGMADHVRRAITEQGQSMLLYAPVADQKEFLNAVAYLIRRMDENTGRDNFLRHVPFLKVDTDAWNHLEKAFVDSCERIQTVGSRSHRTQDRSARTSALPANTEATGAFTNEPDTDWSLPANRVWAGQIRRQWRKGTDDAPLRIPVVVSGQAVEGDLPEQEIVDPNQLPERICVATYRPAQPDLIDAAIRTARLDPDGWRGLSPAQRHAVLSKVAEGLRNARGDLIGAAAAETGKCFTEADIEVSEAIDFAEYYPFSVRAFEARANIEIRGRGVGVVVSPWNFPIAIPCGGILAALAAGNTVVFKPSSNAVLTAWQLCRIFWEAGVSRNTLQFLPCRGDAAGGGLAGHPDVDFVILTGGTSTGLNMLATRPDLFLAAETGGKNATIVTAMADREQAIKNVIHSAFGHGGQKCSATSLLILEKEVYNDPAFKKALVDAAQSLSVGSAWSFRNRMGPLIQPPVGALQRGLTTLEHGETWALEPRMIGDNPNVWTPGIKWGVQAGSYTHTTELFGPVLGVMRAYDLDEAVALANQTGYGLTAGIESLDPREIAHWKATIRAGNLYINRGTTGAVTLRQPFGGMGKSAIGPGIKAGGPNYVAQFMRFADKTPPPAVAAVDPHPLLDLATRWQRKVRWGELAPWASDLDKTARAVKSYLYWAQAEFKRTLDYFHLPGQDNQLRYLPANPLFIGVHPDDSLFEVLARLCAARIAGCRIIINLPPDLDSAAAAFLETREGLPLLEGVDLRRLSESGAAAILPELERMRYAAPDRVPGDVYRAAAARGLYIAREPVLMEGRIELLHYLLNQSICDSYNRHGNLGERAMAEQERK